ncbi:hypothetical protein FSP39_021995 [Pinctada imbricata]|uniref:Uncharacterized protein n=1 Tax=Pinctada imbricata TaxID=66713 RepID=A0AA88Y167_PINIB|nr:hypothetical protein FSP39_021995 [Pinctada imbricata]
MNIDGGCGWPTGDAYSSRAPGPTSSLLGVMEIFNESLEKIINLKPYWNLVVRDEERYENGRFESQMNSAIQSLTLLQGTLCNYIHSKTDCNSNITVPQQVLNVTRSMRFMRDYVIARDTVNVILCIYLISVLLYGLLLCISGELLDTMANLKFNLLVASNGAAELKASYEMEILHMSYEKVSTLKPYWNIIFNDENNHENGRMSRSIKQVRNRLRAIRNTICKVMRDYYNGTDCNSINVPNVNSFILNLPRNIRFQRDYIIARDTDEILKCVAGQYKTNM